MIGVFFGIGPAELLVLAAILAVAAAPSAAVGIVIWILVSRRSRGPKD